MKQTFQEMQQDAAIRQAEKESREIAAEEPIEPALIRLSMFVLSDLVARDHQSRPYHIPDGLEKS